MEIHYHLVVLDQYLAMFILLILGTIAVTPMLAVARGAVILLLLPVLHMVPVRPIMLPAIKAVN